MSGIMKVFLLLAVIVCITEAQRKCLYYISIYNSNKENVRCLIYFCIRLSNC